MGGWEEHFTVSEVMTQGQLGLLPPYHAAPPPPPAASALGRDSKGASSFGTLVWQSLWGLGSFWETQPAGPALPRVSVTLKTSLPCAHLSVLVWEVGVRCSLPP